MKEHFYQALNETEHLEEMEKRGGDEHWIDRFFAKHLVLLYYWIMVAYYLIDPIDAYDINMKIEKHAFEKKRILKVLAIQDRFSIAGIWRPPLGWTLPRGEKV